MDALNTLPVAEPLSAEQIASLKSVGKIARLLQRAPMSIYRVIARLEIQPVLDLDTGALYDDAAIARISAAMRRPNHNKRPAPAATFALPADGQ